MFNEKKVRQSRKCKSTRREIAQIRSKEKAIRGDTRKICFPNFIQSQNYQLSLERVETKKKLVPTEERKKRKKF